MVHEISQFDITDRQLLARDPQSNLGKRNDIGEAKVTHTIFGRAKVRIIREQDKKRRTWLLSLLAVLALAAAVQGWLASRQPEQVATLPQRERVYVSPPAFLPEYLPFPAATPPVANKPIPPAPIETGKLAASQKSAPQQASGLKASVPSGQVAAQPVTAQPLVAIKPQPAPIATSNSSLKNQTNVQQPPKLSPTKQPVAPVVAAPRVNLPAVQLPASSPADVAPHAEPVVKESAPAQSSPGGNQPPAPVNAQP